MNSEDPNHNPSFAGTRMPKYQGRRRTPRTAPDAPPAPEVEEQELSVSNYDATMATIKKLLEEGRLHRVLVKDEYGNVRFEISLTAGVLGTVLFPSLASFVWLASKATRRRIVIERVPEHFPG